MLEDIKVEQCNNPQYRTYHLRIRLSEVQGERLLNAFKKIDGVEGMHRNSGSLDKMLGYGFSVGKGENFSWDEVEPRVLRIIRNHI